MHEIACDDHRINFASNRRSHVLPARGVLIIANREQVSSALAVMTPFNPSRDGRQIDALIRQKRQKCQARKNLEVTLLAVEEGSSGLWIAVGFGKIIQAVAVAV